MRNKPNKSEVFIDLRKCSEEQIKAIPQILEKAGQRVFVLTRTDLENGITDQGHFLEFYIDEWVNTDYNDLSTTTELTYSQFLDMMGESKEVLQVENNGWIKIESEKDLPKEDISCWWMDKKDGMILGKFLIENNNSDIDFILENATHYQPLIIPEPPKF